MMAFWGYGVFWERRGAETFLIYYFSKKITFIQTGFTGLAKKKSYPVDPVDPVK
jgi:hypothetical protein